MKERMLRSSGRYCQSQRYCGGWLRPGDMGAVIDESLRGRKLLDRR